LLIVTINCFQIIGGKPYEEVKKKMKNGIIFFIGVIVGGKKAESPP